MSRRLLVAVGFVLSACGGSNPAAPDGVSAIQAQLDRMTPDLKINGAAVQSGPTVNVTAGAMLSYQVNYTNNSGQTLHTAIVAVRDDGVERIHQCGASGSGGQGGSFGSTSTVFANDTVYTRGHTVRLMLLGAFNSSQPGPGQCYLMSGTSFDQVNHANVQAERLLLTLAVQ